MTLTYPELRTELIAHLEDLSDRRKIESEGPTGSWLDYAVHFLFDDTVLAEDPTRAIGWFLFDEHEASVVHAVTQALNRVFDVHGTEMSDREYANCPEWGEVVEASNLAHTTLVEADTRRPMQSST